jgi:hydroxyacylglutathione hydrolase
MISVKQFRYGTDNLGYLILGRQAAVAVDGGLPERMLLYLAERGLKLKWVINTHSHHDHTRGNRSLLDNSTAEFLGYRELQNRSVLPLEEEEILIIPTPGHTDDSLCFYAAGALLTGDTLFNGTIGNCFSGEVRSFYDSLRRLIAFPADTLVLAGHDYVQMAMDFLLALDEGEEANVRRYLSLYQPGEVRSRLEDELAVNPYLRFDDPWLAKVLAQRGLDTHDSWQRWLSLMSID